MCLRKVEEEDTREELPVGAVESDFDVQRAVRVQYYADGFQRRRERRERRKPKNLFCVTVKCRQIARFYFLLLV